MELDTTKASKELIKSILFNSNKYIRIDSGLVMKSNLPASVKVMVKNLEEGKCRVATYLPKLFYAIYPDLKLSVIKDGDGSYLNSMKENIARACGELSETQTKKAMAYYLGVLCGLGRIDSQTYSEIMEELKKYVSNNC